MGLGLGISLTKGGAFETPFESSLSVEFDGSDDWIDTGTGLGNTLGNDYAGSLSMSLWFKCDVTEDEDTGLISIGTSLSSDNGIFTVRIQNDKILYLLNSATASNTWRRRVAFTDTASWHHLVCVYNTTDTSGAGGGAASKMYIDGTATGAILGDNNVFPVDGDMDFNGKKTVIGTYYTANFDFDGKIDDVAIWNTVLDDDGVTAIYNAGSPTDLSVDSGNYDISSNLVGYWKMGDGDTFPTITDHSDEGNDGTMTTMASDDIQTDTPPN